MSEFGEDISLEYCSAQVSFAAYSNGGYLRLDKFKPSNFSASWSTAGSSSSLSASSSSACSSKNNNEKYQHWNGESRLISNILQLYRYI